MFKSIQYWQKNLIILWISTFLTGIALSEVMPFFSLFIDTLGDFTTSELNFYNSVAFSSSFLVTAIVSPLWGKLADKVGRKPMLVRASVGLVIIMLLMGLVTNVWQILILRLLQGAFAGYVANATAIVAKETPKESTGYAMGVIATGFTSGGLIGPIFGGVLAQYLGFRETFFVTAVIMLGVSILSAKGVQETNVLEQKENENEFKKLDNFKLKDLKAHNILIALFLSTLLIQATTTAINPLMALFVRDIVGGRNQYITLIAGIVASAPGITTIIFAPKFGKISDRFGTTRLIEIGFVIGFVSLFLTSFASNIYYLILLRLLTGVANSILTPSIQTLITKDTPENLIGRIFSYNQSYQAFGNFAGPLAGAFVASLFGYASVFIFGSILIVINLIFFYITVSRQKQFEK